jgi:hypothetical protein
MAVAGTWIVSTLLAALCCAAAGPDAVPFTTLDSGVQSGIEGSRQLSVRAAPAWTSLCAEYAAGRPCPSVDFTRSTVLAIFLGTRPTAGFRVEIVRVERVADAIVVTWRERKPGPDEMAAQMMTTPFLLATIERTAATIRFVQVK